MEVNYLNESEITVKINLNITGENFRSIERLKR